MKNTIAENGQTKLLTANQRKWMNIWRNREFYIFCIPGIICAILFQYYPMYGVLMAFKNVKIGMTVAQGTWIGLDNFQRLFEMEQFWMYFRNTLNLNIWVLVVSVPLPLVVALLLHNSPSQRLKSITQTCTYLPYMLSLVVITSLIDTFFANSYGLVNVLLRNLGFERIKFQEETGWFVPLYVISAIWQSIGYNAIVYLASLSSVDQSVVEAATIDGATKAQRMWHIDTKLIVSTIATMMLLKLGHIMTLSSMEKVLLMQNPANLSVSETIATYVYTVGIQQTQYGFSTAVSLFNTAANLLILFISNWVSKKVADTSLF